MTRKQCVICEKYITETFHVCMKCLKTYDIPYSYRDWPKWLKALVNIELKNLAIKRIEIYSLPYFHNGHDLFDVDRPDVRGCDELSEKDIREKF